MRQGHTVAAVCGRRNRRRSGPCIVLTPQRHLLPLRLLGWPRRRRLGGTLRLLWPLRRAPRLLRLLLRPCSVLFLRLLSCLLARRPLLCLVLLRVLLLLLLRVRMRHRCCAADCCH